MAFDFNEVKTGDNLSSAADEFCNQINLKIGEVLKTDACPIGDNTGHEYLESRGYFDAGDKYLVVDPMYYLDLFPAVCKNFGITILEPGLTSNPMPLFGKGLLNKPQLVFKQVYGEITPAGVQICNHGKLLHLFVGICLIKKAEDKYNIYKLWDIFIFNPDKTAK